MRRSVVTDRQNSVHSYVDSLTQYNAPHPHYNPSHTSSSAFSIHQHNSQPVHPYPVYHHPRPASTTSQPNILTRTASAAAKEKLPLPYANIIRRMNESLRDMKDQLAGETQSSVQFEESTRASFHILEKAVNDLNYWQKDMKKDFDEALDKLNDVWKAKFEVLEQQQKRNEELIEKQQTELLNAIGKEQKVRLELESQRLNFEEKIISLTDELKVTVNKLSSEVNQKSEQEQQLLQKLDLNDQMMRKLMEEFGKIDREKMFKDTTTAHLSFMQEQKLKELCAELIDSKTAVIMEQCLKRVNQPPSQNISQAVNSITQPPHVSSSHITPQNTKKFSLEDPQRHIEEEKLFYDQNHTISKQQQQISQQQQLIKEMHLELTKISTNHTDRHRHEQQYTFMSPHQTHPARHSQLYEVHHPLHEHQPHGTQHQYSLNSTGAGYDRTTIQVSSRPNSSCSPVNANLSARINKMKSTHNNKTNEHNTYASYRMDDEPQFNAQNNGEREYSPRMLRDHIEDLKRQQSRQARMPHTARSGSGEVE